LHTAKIRLDHVRLDVRDIGLSEKFYSEALGLRLVVRYETNDHIIAQMAPDGVPPGVELWMEASRIPKPNATEHIAFSVADVPCLVERVRRLGYAIKQEPSKIGAETVAFIAGSSSS
jgi:catechol 2,3-dioxygenase-like lactoylglutathione lyase family enzyme